MLFAPVSVGAVALALMTVTIGVLAGRAIGGTRARTRTMTTPIDAGTRRAEVVLGRHPAASPLAPWP